MEVMASDTVEKIKTSLSILDVVTPYVKLARAGKYWRGLSPFTKEKTPSFQIQASATFTKVEPL
jgi:DNA primase